MLSNRPKQVTFCNYIFSNIGRQCKNLKPPLYGKISLPCLTYFGSICTVECMDTHYLIGYKTDRCIVAENDTMEWKNKNQCRGKFF